MWEWESWQQFLDAMVRNRYNVLKLGTTHPYPGIFKLPGYPQAGSAVVALRYGGRTWKYAFDENTITEMR
jgi:hypothetical protein